MSSASTGRSASAAKSSRVPKVSSSTVKSTVVPDNGATKNQVNGQQSYQASPVLPKSCYPYQYRGTMEVDYSSNSNSNSFKNSEVFNSRAQLTRTHRTMRLGLGTPLNNLKSAHIINGKKCQPGPKPTRNVIPGYRNVQLKKGNGAKTQNSKDSCSGSSLTSQMRKLKIYESPKENEEVLEDIDKPSVFDKAFKSLNTKFNAVVLGQNVNFYLGGRTISVQNKNTKTADAVDKIESKSKTKENAEAIPNLCRHLRGIFSWKMSLHLRWKYAEERVQKWPSKLTPVTVDEIADLLKISEGELLCFQIIPDLKDMFEVLRKNICHVNAPNIAKLLALSELQQGNTNVAARCLSEAHGMFLKGDIIDKHLNYIRRHEESILDSTRNKEDLERESFKTSLFNAQVKDTLKFTETFFESGVKSDFIKKLSAFDPNWNIVQISTSVQSTNRFSNHIIGKRQVPQLILSAFCHVPDIKSRCEFTTFCREPHVDIGSMMRYGLIEEFQKVLDNNLAISDEWTVISRKKYWEERAKHNQSMDGIMYAMEDWLNPWIFLLPGRIKDKSIQDLIEVNVLSDVNLIDSTDSQKLLIYRLTENYKMIPDSTKLCLDTLVAYILKIDEETAKPIAQKIDETSRSISASAPRHPTILILDQEIDGLPWDWIPSLRSTDVTRMPSLNLINSSNNMNTMLKPAYPSIVNPKKCTFILNPDGTLPNVQQRMEAYLKGRKEWVPIVARSPTTQEMQDALENQDVLLYLGHGAGSNYYPEYAVQKLVCRAVPVLMGCSSTQSHYSGPRLYANSVVNTYFIAGCPSVVGFLWEVTDTECDRLTVDFLERWLPNRALRPPKMPFFDPNIKREKEKYIPTALRKSRVAATQLLTQCAAVCFGLPAATIDS